MDMLAGYTSSSFQDSKSYLRTEIDLVEDDNKLLLYENKSTFITCELEPRIYTFKDLSEALSKILQPKYEPFNNSIVIEFDGITMKAKWVVRSGIIAIRFDGNLLLILF